MSTASSSLSDLVERINQQEAQLAKLRQEYNSRQTQLAELARRKEALQAQLQAVESEIKAVGNVGEPRPEKAAVAQPNKVAPKAEAKLKVEAKAQAAGVPKPTTLAGFILRCVQHAKGPVTIKDLVAEFVRQKYPTTSSDVPGMIQTRLSELVKKGLLQRAGDQGGVVLSMSGAAAKPAVTKKLGSAGGSVPKKASTAKPMVSAKPAGAAKKKSLKTVLEEVLAKSSRPLSTNQLAEQIRASGYKTKSQDFNNVIWVAIGGMKNVERVAEGYRLKKSKR